MLQIYRTHDKITQKSSYFAVEETCCEPAFPVVNYERKSQEDLLLIVMQGDSGGETPLLCVFLGDFCKVYSLPYFNPRE